MQTMQDHDRTTGSPQAGFPPLDPTTERLVSELAARLLPPLTQALARSAAPRDREDAAQELKAALKDGLDGLSRALQEDLRGEAERRQALLQPLAAAVDEIASLRVFFGEATGSIRSAREDAQALARMREALSRLEGAVKEGSEEGRSCRQALIAPLGTILDELSALRGEVRNAGEALRAVSARGKGAGELHDEATRLRGLLERSEERDLERREELKTAAEAVARAAEGLRRGLEAEREAVRETTGDAPGVEALKRLMDVAIPSWEGMLRAHRQAQTRELDALSKELSNLESQTSAAMEQTIQETLRRELAAREEEWSRRLSAERAETAERTRKLIWILLGLAGLSGLSVLCAVAALLR